MPSKSSSKASTPMTPAAASRIQSSGAKSSGGGVAKGSFAARAQSAAASKPAPQAGKSNSGAKKS